MNESGHEVNVFIVMWYLSNDVTRVAKPRAFWVSKSLRSLGLIVYLHLLGWHKFPSLANPREQSQQSGGSYPAMHLVVPKYILF